MRVRDCLPPPQALEHFLFQRPHLPTTQSTGQSISLQEAYSWVWPQALPDIAAALTMVRVRVWEPVRQEAVQVDQVDQADMWQSEGQLEEVSQGAVSVISALRQSLPPKPAAILMPRVRVLTPWPQETEQAAEEMRAWLQVPRTQSTGQGWALQVRSVSEAVGQGLPPYLGVVRVRVRVREPEPQLAEQVDQRDQRPTLQSSGQVWALHERVVASRGQALPPNLAATFTNSLRVWTPVPQVLEHSVHIP